VLITAAALWGLFVQKPVEDTPEIDAVP
jgi:hypothetical protein